MYSNVIVVSLGVLTEWFAVSIRIVTENSVVSIGAYQYDYSDILVCCIYMIILTYWIVISGG